MRLQSRAHSAHTSKIETDDLWNGHHSRDNSHVRQKHAKTTRCSANIFSSIENSIISLSTTVNLSSIVRAAWQRRDQSWSPSRLPSTLPIADHSCDEESISRCAFGGDGKSTGVASRFGNTSRRQSSPVGKPTEAAGARKFGERDGRSLPRQARAYRTALLRHKPPGQRSDFRRRAKTIGASPAKLLSGTRTMSRQ